MNDRIHSTKAAALGSILPTLRQEPGPKPRGLWWAVGDDWIEWCRGERFRTDTLRRTFKLDIDDSKLLVIGREMSLDQFDREFHIDTDWQIRNREIGQTIRYAINWPRVAALYSGIEIPVYSWAHRHELMWYYGWDVASGCIWKQDALRGIERVSQKSIRRREVA